MRDEPDDQLLASRQIVGSLLTCIVSVPFSQLAATAPDFHLIGANKIRKPKPLAARQQQEVPLIPLVS